MGKGSIFAGCVVWHVPGLAGGGDNLRRDNSRDLPLEPRHVDSTIQHRVPKRADPCRGYPDSHTPVAYNLLVAVDFPALWPMRIQSLIRIAGAGHRVR